MDGGAAGVTWSGLTPLLTRRDGLVCGDGGCNTGSGLLLLDSPVLLLGLLQLQTPFEIFGGG